jgi:hypothetical protein
VLTGTAKTNDFGVANVDWDLPDSVVRGPYFLQVALSNCDRYGSAQAATNVRISRYDLPNFTVAAKPDRSYYLPGQNASIEVVAKYLFGKELTRGSVKLVREEEGHWDSTERKWVVNQADTQSGELDRSGSAKFTIDLTDLQAGLSREKYRRFEDLNYAAYVTDPTTGKTEQRRFQVRLSREPIHVYVSRSALLGDRAFFYISTYYPDGTPAECEVSISEGRNHHVNYGDEDVQSGGRDFLRTIKTNRFGAARIYNLQISTDPDNSDQYHGYPLIFDVRDRHGATTTYNEVFWDDSHDRILLTTDKAMYGPNEPKSKKPWRKDPQLMTFLRSLYAISYVATGWFCVQQHQGITGPRPHKCGGHIKHPAFRWTSPQGSRNSRRRAKSKDFELAKDPRTSYGSGRRKIRKHAQIDSRVICSYRQECFGLDFTRCQ